MSDNIEINEVKYPDTNMGNSNINVKTTRVKAEERRKYILDKQIKLNKKKRKFITINKIFEKMDERDEICAKKPHKKRRVKFDQKMVDESMINLFIGWGYNVIVNHYSRKIFKRIWRKIKKKPKVVIEY